MLNRTRILRDERGYWACVIATAAPAIVIEPLRVAPVSFAAAVTITAPFPDPLPGATEIQSSALDAVHAQLAPVVMAIVADPPAASNCAVFGETVNKHGA
jgi:hypothetical protein